MEGKTKKYDLSNLLTIGVFLYEVFISVKCLFYPESLRESTIIMIGIIFLLNSVSTIYDFLINKED